MRSRIVAGSQMHCWLDSPFCSILFVAWGEQMTSKQITKSRLLLGHCAGSKSSSFKIIYFQELLI